MLAQTEAAVAHWPKFFREVRALCDASETGSVDLTVDEILHGAQSRDRNVNKHWWWNLMMDPGAASHKGVLENEMECEALPATDPVAHVVFRLRLDREKGDGANDSLGEEFRRLAAEWKSQSEFLASPTAIAALPAYQAIIEMGPAAVPRILSELRREPDHWFVALKKITGEDPVPEDARGDLDRMAEAWLKWGRVHGIEGEPPSFIGLSAPQPRQP